MNLVGVLACFIYVKYSEVESLASGSKAKLHLVAASFIYCVLMFIYQQLG
jgi:hypothetical protein